MKEEHTCKEKNEFTGKPSVEFPDIKILFDKEAEIWYLFDSILDKKQGIPIKYCPYCRKLPK